MIFLYKGPFHNVFRSHTSERSSPMSKPTAKKMSKSERRDNINGFLFALPWIIGFVCFSLIPLLTSFYYSFTSFNPVKPPEWIGLENFKYIFKDPLVFKSLKNTLFMAFVSTPINLFIAMLLASLLNSKFRAEAWQELFSSCLPSSRWLQLPWYGSGCSILHTAISTACWR